MRHASMFLLLAAVLLLPAFPSAQAPRTIEIKADDNMKFSIDRITASPGERLRVVLWVESSMPKAAMAHNFVLLEAGVDPRTFVGESVMAGPAANYISEANEASVIAHTSLAGARETVEVVFTAPATGTYTFLCTFPGHFAADMRGTLVVE